MQTKVQLVLDKVFANGKKVRWVTIVLFKFGPVCIGTCKIPGRNEDDTLILKEVRNNPTRMKWNTDDPILRNIVIPNKAVAA
jgi:hypothetical protein